MGTNHGGGVNFPRRSTIRFSDSEWETVEKAAAERGMNAAEFARHAALGVADGKYGAEQGALPPQYAGLLERIFRSTHILVTLKRDELIREGRGEELDELVKATRALQDSLFRERLSTCIGVPVPDHAFVAMDYHLDWIQMALHLAENSAPRPGKPSRTPASATSIRTRKTSTCWSLSRRGRQSAGDASGTDRSQGVPALDQQAAEVQDRSAPRDIRRRRNAGQGRGTAFCADDRQKIRQHQNRHMARLDKGLRGKPVLADVRLGPPPEGHALHGRRQARQVRRTPAPRLRTTVFRVAVPQAPWLPPGRSSSSRFVPFRWLGLPVAAAQFFGGPSRSSLNSDCRAMSKPWTNAE